MVQQAVQDGVGDGGFADDGMPVFDRALAGDHGGSFLITILDDFEQVVTLGIAERSQKQIVQDEQLDLGKPGQSERAKGQIFTYDIDPFKIKDKDLTLLISLLPY